MQTEPTLSAYVKRIDAALSALLPNEKGSAVCDAMRYSVSVGAAWQSREELDMDGLLKEAEQNMYAEKRAYYQNGGHDRRHRGGERF